MGDDGQAMSDDGLAALEAIRRATAERMPELCAAVETVQAALVEARTEAQRERERASRLEAALGAVHQQTKRQQRQQAQELQSRLKTTRHDLNRLGERHAKLAMCVNAELAQIRSIIATNQTGGLVGPALAALASNTAAADDDVIATVGVGNLDLGLERGPLAATNEKPVALPRAPTDGTPPPPVAPSVAPHLTPAVDGTWPMRPIGHLRTCFVEKNGTPRQGCVVPSSVATLKLDLDRGLNAKHALEGLASFSHVWLVFVFHKNGNSAAKSKVHPPRMDGDKVGLFATRTPHRPNAIGLSLVKLDAVSADCVHLSGIDLVDGTPILDLKPYVPFADGHTLPASSLAVAPWIHASAALDLTVRFTPEAEAQLLALEPSLRLLKDAAQARSALAEVLAADPRSVHWRQRRGAVEYGFSIDALNAVVAFDDGVATVRQVQHIDLCDRSHCAGSAGMASNAHTTTAARPSTP